MSFLLAAVGQAAEIKTSDQPAQLDIRPAGKSTIRVTLKPISFKTEFPVNPALAERAYEKPVISLREITRAVKARVGGLNVEVLPSPLTIVASTAEGKPIQEVVFQEDGNLSFNIGGEPILGLGEGGPLPRGNFRALPIEFRRGRLEDMRPTLAKGLTSGYVPMGAVVVRDKIAQHFEGKMLPLGSTYQAHPLACAAALACLEEYEERGLIPHARKMGEVLFERLGRLARKHPSIGDVRGKGLLACLELVRDRTAKTPLVPPNTDSTLPMQIRNKAWEEGIHILARGSLILLSPPLIIEPAQIDEGIAKLDRVLAWLEETERIG
jgi:hypothetical protein